MSIIRTEEIRHFHLFCGLGGGAKGFNEAEARLGNVRAKYRCIGGIDVDAAAIKDFNKLAGVPGTVLDLFDSDQYFAFHGKRHGADWREATRVDIHKAAGNESPNIVFLSAPCKGFSGLLSEGKSKTDKYQALNRLTVRGVWLMLEAFSDDPPELIVFENVPRIQRRGRHLMDQIIALLRSYGYATAETTHDCGELGELAQSRKRFLMVARHVEKVPNFLYEPPKKNLKSVGSVLSRMPLPGDPAGGPMHRIPALFWKTWVRLAFVEAGYDWRSLNRLAVEDGMLRDYLIVPEYRGGYMGVNHWDSHVNTISGRSTPTNGAYSVADVRYDGHEYSQYGVIPFDDSMGAVSGQSKPGGGKYVVADPRLELKHNNCFRIVHFDKHAGTVTGGTGPSAGGQGVADPLSRTGFGGKGKYIVTPFDAHTNTVISGSTTGQGAFAVADGRTMPEGLGSTITTGFKMPEASEKLIAIIRALDNTWHRPFTTLELAALQGLVDPEEQLILDGLSDQSWRERIGNAVPPPAAKAIASEMGRAILLARTGGTMALEFTPIWVRPVAVALNVAQQELP